MTSRASAAGSRMVEVAPERLTGWVERFTASHGAVAVEVDGHHLVLRAADGEVADLEVPWPPLPVPRQRTGGPHPGRRTAGPHPARAATAGAEEELVPVAVRAEPVAASATGALDEVAALTAHAATPRTALLVLVRRGGYAAGTARGGVLTDHTTGTRYVQSRTAAGGWSQQRYARRRSGQSAALVESATAAVSTVVARAAVPPEVLVVGGDRLLVEDVLAGLDGAVSALPRSPLLDVGDPRLAVLVDVAARARAVRVRVGHV